MIPTDPSALLTRSQTAEALREAGFPVAKATLATIASRRCDGPPFMRFGPRVLYRWGDAFDWAHGRLGSPIRSTAEADAGTPQP